jgi:hypothetical protein
MTKYAELNNEQKERIDRFLERGADKNIRMTVSDDGTAIVLRSETSESPLATLPISHFLKALDS